MTIMKCKYFPLEKACHALLFITKILEPFTSYTGNFLIIFIIITIVVVIIIIIIIIIIIVIFSSSSRRRRRSNTKI